VRFVRRTVHALDMLPQFLMHDTIIGERLTAPHLVDQLLNILAGLLLIRVELPLHLSLQLAEHLVGEIVRLSIRRHHSASQTI
jgi:hypothetical protein